MTKKLLLGAVLVLSGYAVGRASQPAPARVYEMRTYVANEGKMDAMHARFRDHTIRLFQRHNIKSVGYWTPLEGPTSGTTLVYLLEHSSREEARKNWAAFNADPEWQKAKAESEATGRLVAKGESVFLAPTGYSPIK